MCCLIDTLTTTEDIEEPVAKEVLVPVPAGLQIRFFILQNFVPHKPHLELPGPPETGMFTRFQLLIYLSMHMYACMYVFIYLCMYVYVNAS